MFALTVLQTTNNASEEWPGDFINDLTILICSGDDDAIS